MPEVTSGGDPARTLALLWREPTAGRRGPQRGLSLDAVIDAATALADADGLEALTMRRIAQRLAVSPMTLYTYTPAKAELLDLMLDAAYTRMPRADTAGRPWRERLTAVARENRVLFRTHPWAAAVSTSRPLLGPGAVAKYEHELRALDGAGLDDVAMDDCLSLVLTFVQANARPAADARATAALTAMTEQQWWAAAGPLLARVLDPATYPLATRVGAAAGAAHGSAHDPEHAYEFGLTRILDGISRLVDQRSGGDHGGGRPAPVDGWRLTADG